MWYKPVVRFEDQRDPSSPAHIQAKAVGSFTDAESHPEISRHDLLANPLRLSGMPAVPRAPAPAFGSHTVGVLSELGLGEAEVAALMKAGVAAVSKGDRPSRQ